MAYGMGEGRGHTNGGREGHGASATSTTEDTRKRGQFSRRIQQIDLRGETLPSLRTLAVKSHWLISQYATKKADFYGAVDNQTLTLLRIGSERPGYAVLHAMPTSSSARLQRKSLGLESGLRRTPLDAECSFPPTCIASS